MQIFRTKVSKRQKNRTNICSHAKIIVLLQTNYVYTPFCGISTSVVHRLPKPRRRVRFPYAALGQLIETIFETVHRSIAE